MRTRCIIFCVVLTLASIGQACANVIIIAHPSVPVDTIRRMHLKEIFLGKRTKWRNNSAIRCALAENSESHKKFLKAYLHQSPMQFEMHWRNMIFTGQGNKPLSVASVEALVDYVAATPGAIGYVLRLPDTAKVKILTVK